MTNPLDFVSHMGTPVEDAVLMQLRDLGGPGSGNFGHSGGEGGKGNPGGSSASEGGSESYFHGTSAENLEQIRTSGLLRAKVGQYWQQSKPGVVYIASDRVTATNYALMAQRKEDLKRTSERGFRMTDPVILGVRIPDDVRALLRADSNIGHTDKEFEFHGDIKPEWISDIWIFDQKREEWRSAEEPQQGVVFYVPLLVPRESNELRDAGGRTLGLRVAKKTGSRVRSAKIRYDVTNEDAADWARKHAAKLAKGLSKTTRKNIREAIALGFEGVDFDTVVAGVMEMVGDEARAKLIARTESMAAVSAGQRQAWARDVEEGWLTGRERRVWIAVPGACPLCEELDGTTARLDGTYKGDIEGPPLHPRCRCTEGLS